MPKTQVFQVVLSEDEEQLLQRLVEQLGCSPEELGQRLLDISFDQLERPEQAQALLSAGNQLGLLHEEFAAAQNTSWQSTLLRLRRSGVGKALPATKPPINKKKAGLTSIEETVPLTEEERWEVMTAGIDQAVDLSAIPSSLSFGGGQEALSDPLVPLVPLGEGGTLESRPEGTQAPPRKRRARNATPLPRRAKVDDWEQLQQILRDTLWGQFQWVQENWGKPGVAERWAYLKRVFRALDVKPPRREARSEV